MSNLSLEIKMVKLSDAGEYSCVASNEGGITVASVFLIVQGNMERQSLLLQRNICFDVFPNSNLGSCEF